MHLGITQEELAWRADMHRTYLADIERGARNITLRSIANLATALQLSVGGLLFETRGAEGIPSRPDRLGRPEEILLVEDNPQDIELAQRAFQRANIVNPITVLTDGRDALDYLHRTGPYATRRRALPQLVLLDLNLPRVAGLEVLREMRRHEATRNIPVVIMTVSRSETDIQACRQLGATDYIVKPVEFDRFARVASNLDFKWTLLPPSPPGPVCRPRRKRPAR